jgi:hypothetical protein
MKPYYRILRLNHGRAPTVQHATLKEAETEALRLAGQHPGEQFEILQCLAIAQTSQPSLFWCDWVEPPIQAVSLAPKPELPALGVLCGDGYRFLEPREVIEEGDEFFVSSTGRWVECSSMSIGFAVDPRAGVAFRRKLPVAPGEGYRLLEPGEILAKGDEFWNGRGEWRPWVYSIGGPLCSTPTRRKLPQAPEPAPEVEPGEGYRLVKNGELIETGDEWLERDGSWKPTAIQTEDVLEHSIAHPLRRKLPEAEPSYRILEPGEQVLEGDEFYRTSSNTWVPSIARNYLVSVYDAGLYRRPASTTPKP